MDNLLTKKKFVEATKIPLTTINRWLRQGKLKSVAHNEHDKPLFSAEQIKEAKQMHNPDMYRHAPDATEETQSVDTSAGKNDGLDTSAEREVPADENQPVVADVRTEPSGELDESEVNGSDTNVPLSETEGTKSENVCANAGADSDEGTAGVQEESVLVIDFATYNTILAHAEKFHGGQVDFADVLRNDLRENLNVEGDALVEELKENPVDKKFLDRVRNFLSKIPFVVVKENGMKYRLVEGLRDLELIKETVDTETETEQDSKDTNGTPAENNGDFDSIVKRAYENDEHESALPDETEDDVAEKIEGDTNVSLSQPATIERLPVLFESVSPAATLDEHAERILYFARVKDVLDGAFVIAVGRELLAAKELAPYGKFEAWVSEKLHWKIRRAQDYMDITRRFGNTQTFAHFGKSQLKELCALPVGDEDAFIETQAAAGRPVEVQKIKELARNVKEWKTRGSAPTADDTPREIGGSYFNATGSEKNNEVVDELNHAPASPQEPRECVSEGADESKVPDAKIDSEASADEFKLTSTEPERNIISTEDERDESQPADSQAEDNKSLLLPGFDAPLDTEEPKKKLPPIAYNGGGKNVEWYTPEKFVEAAREVLGDIDCDPASCETANKIVKAKLFYTIENDGLRNEWRGRIWMNPPFSSGLIEQFVNKLLNELDSGNVTSAIVLVDNATETRWFTLLAIHADAICFTNFRINFLSGGDFKAGSPTRGQAFLYFGTGTDKFVEVFQKFGWLVRPVKIKESTLFDEEENLDAEE